MARMAEETLEASAPKPLYSWAGRSLTLAPREQSQQHTILGKERSSLISSKGRPTGPSFETHPYRHRFEQIVHAQPQDVDTDAEKHECSQPHCDFRADGTEQFFDIRRETHAYVNAAPQNNGPHCHADDMDERNTIAEPAGVGRDCNGDRSRANGDGKNQRTKAFARSVALRAASDAVRDSVSRSPPDAACSRFQPA